LKSDYNQYRYFVTLLIIEDSMKIPSVLPLTAAQSRASRFQLGLTQAEVIEQSGLPGYKLKQFETGRFVPDMPYLQALHDFYQSKGIDLTTADEQVPTVPDVKPGSDMIRHVQRPCFYVSDSISPELLDQCLNRMHANDERIAQIMNINLQNGMFGEFHKDTIREHQELFGAMAEGYLIFRLLQGNPIVEPFDGEIDPVSHADLVGQFYSKSPVLQKSNNVSEVSQ
jgi:transcriptional regulator with XRE-family HTH domain